MRTGILLEQLIKISQMPKTDFAISMHITPSGLSKILTGKRLPAMKEKRSFSAQAAHYFAEAIYSLDCYLRFRNVFPVIYDFNSKLELEMFLEFSIEYALEQDFALEYHENMDFPDKEVSYLGKKAVLNLLCVIVSDCVVSDRENPFEFYSTLPLFDGSFADIFKRIRVTDSERQTSISFHHFFNPSALDPFDNMLSAVVNAQKYVDLSLWKMTKEISHHFLFLKGKFLLLFSLTLDETPLMTMISRKSYLSLFFNALMTADAKKISFSGSEARETLEKDSSFLKKLDGARVDAVYNFISIGYLVGDKEMDAAVCSPSVKKFILNFFNHVLTKETIFFVTVDAMVTFFATGKAIVPLVGALDIAPEERVPYLERFNAFINEKSRCKIRLINSDLPKVAVFCLKGMNFIYMIDLTRQSEKIHCIPSNRIHESLSAGIADGTIKMLEFSPDLWDTYISELQKRARPTV